jgi:hypothetical protein
MLRRTWKTLAGNAGISKEMRDRLQNHSKGDVSSRHYDRYDYLVERGFDMLSPAKSADVVEGMLIGKYGDPNERIPGLVRTDRGETLETVKDIWLTPHGPMVLETRAEGWPEMSSLHLFDNKTQRILRERQLKADTERRGQAIQKGKTAF